MENNRMKKAAVRYLKGYNFSVFPVNLYWDEEEGKVRKKPRVKWSTYQSETPTEAQIGMWFQLNPRAGVGIVTGKINDLFVLDVDTKDGEKYIEQRLKNSGNTPKVRTGSGGVHYYFKYPKNSDISIGARIAGEEFEGLGLDFRGKGGFVVAPPSPYPLESEVKRYEWERSIKDNDPPKPPEWLIDAIEKNGGKNKTDGNIDFSAILDGVEEGSRNVSATKVAGSLLNRFDPKRWDLAWETLKSWNENRNDPPLEEEELKGVFEGIADREKRKREEKSLTITNGVELIESDYDRDEIINNGIMAPGQLVLLVGAPKTGKTLLALDMVEAIANKRKIGWLDFKIDKHCKVLFLSGEGGGKLLQDRIKKRGMNKETLSNVNFWWPEDREKVKINKEESVTQVIKLVNQTESEVLFIDPFIKFHEFDENSTQDMAALMDSLWDIREQTGAALVLVHHTRKGGVNSRNGSLMESRGSSALAGEIDTGLMLERKKSHNEMNLDFELRWDTEPPTHELKLEDDLTFNLEGKFRRGEGHIKTSNTEIVDILKEYGEWMTTEEIANKANDGSGVAESTAGSRLEELVEEGHVEKKRGVRKDVHGNTYCYRKK